MKFSKVAILGLPRKGNSVKQTIVQLIAFFKHNNMDVYAEPKMISVYHLRDVEPLNTDSNSQRIDLAIVVGGDGSMLGACRNLAKFNIPVIGINRGHLGFLTDLKPNRIEDALSQVINDGKFTVERRNLMDVFITEDDIVLEKHQALNEAVIHPKKVAHMFEFEIYIDDQFMNSMKADGMIISSPTGSTAYALSAGGPIMCPDIRAYCLIPMFPHTLNNRPIVIYDKHTITVDFLGDESSEIAIDGQITVNVAPHQKVVIKKSQTILSLIHPTDYSYYNVLREKLGWGAKLF
ncbi:MAG: NAD(+) kinase [Succinivibrionaceae bacterium]|jgi:NAD+ kinase|nr:NAD(+) kinase [Succinivibrionaceae bacterium]